MKDLTEGNTYRSLVGFAVPILMGNLLQLTYNAVDSVVVGRYAGETALAAVGISNPIMSMIILGASGISIGASAFMGKCYGAKKDRRTKEGFCICYHLWIGDVSRNCLTWDGTVGVDARCNASTRESHAVIRSVFKDCDSEFPFYISI